MCVVDWVARWIDSYSRCIGHMIQRAGQGVPWYVKEVKCRLTDRLVDLAWE